MQILLNTVIVFPNIVELASLETSLKKGRLYTYLYQMIIAGFGYSTSQNSQEMLQWIVDSLLANLN